MSSPRSRRDGPTGRGRALVIWNASAGHKRPLGAALSREALTELLTRSTLDFELVETASVEEAAKLAAEAARERRPMVVAAGGDGTIGTVATELIGSQTALGILPLGSVMNVPRMLGVPRDVEAAAAVLVSGETRVVDVGEANGRPFYEAASVGINATIFSAAERFVAGDYPSVRRLSWLTFRYRPARVRLELDDEVIATRALMVTVAIGPYTGLGMTVAPGARLDDGLFDVRVFRHFSKLELFRHLISISFGRRAFTPHARTYRSAHVRIESRRPLPCRVDGVDVGTTPLECRLLRACLRVVVPRDADSTADSIRPATR